MCKTRGAGQLTLALLAAAATGCERPSTFDGNHQASSAPSVAATASAAAEPAEQAPAKSAALNLASFRALHAGLSETTGSFPTQGYVSNEASYLQVASALPEAVSPGGVYLGVGPEQNFSYIALVKPERAYLVDVRRDNALLHLLYKAAFDLASSRAHFLALVTGRGAGKNDESADSDGIDEVIADVTALERSEQTFAQAHQQLVGRIEQGYGIELSTEDRQSLERAHRALYTSGLDIRFGEPDGCSIPTRPRFRELLAARDPADGKPKSFLASEESFRYVQTLQRENRIIPVVGDIAGDKTMGALAKHLEDEGLKVSVFYVSNVEQYLRQGGAWDKWRDNVAKLPLADRAVIVEDYYGSGSANPCEPTLPTIPGVRPGTSLEPISSLTKKPASAGG